MNVTLEFVCVIVGTMIHSSNPSVDGIENVNMNIRKDERCFFERCSLRKKFCELPCLQSYFVCVSIILVSLSIMPTTIRNSNLSVNIRTSENIRKTCERKNCVQSCFVYASLSRASDSLYHSYSSSITFPLFK